MYLSHGRASERDASRCCAAILMREMKEDRAPAAADAWLEIEIHDSDHVINAVVAPQIFGSRSKRQGHRSVIAVGCWIVAPSIRALDRAAIRSENGPNIFSPAPFNDGKTADRRSPITFTELGRNSIPTDRARDRQRSHRKEPKVRTIGQARQGANG